jgi:hypothetical protein
MSIDIDEAVEKRVAGRFAARLAGKVQDGHQPWVAQVVSWMDLADLCRELDEGLVLAEPPSQNPPRRTYCCTLKFSRELFTYLPFFLRRRLRLY